MVEVAILHGERTASATNDAIVIGTTDGLGLVGSDFTVEAWVAIGEHDPVLHNDLAVLGTHADDLTTNTGLHLTIRGRRPYLGFFANDTASSRQLEIDRWYHLAWRFHDGTQAIFINGLLDTFNTGRAAFAGSRKDVLIGQAFGVYNNNWDSFAGGIAELRIWDHGVSDEDIAARWAVRLDPSDVSGLTGYWPLDDVEQGPADRVSGREGDVIGSPSSTEVDLPLAEPRAMSAWGFLEDNSPVTIPDSRALLAPDVRRFAVEAWVYPAAEEEQPWQEPVVGQHGPATGWELRAARHAQFMVTTLDGHQHLTSPNALVQAQWQHLLGVYADEVITLYVNGLRVASAPASGQLLAFNGPVSLASNPHFGGRQFHGALGSVRVWAGPELDLGALLRDMMWRDAVGDEPGLRLSLPLPVGDLGPILSVLEQSRAQISPLPAPPRSPSAPDDAPTVLPGSAQPSGGGPDRLTPAMQLAHVQRQLAQLRQQNDRLSREREHLEREVAQSLSRIEELRSQTELPQGETTVDNFVRDMRARIEKVRGELSGGGSAYRLGTVRVEAKVLPGSEGASIRFPTPGEVDGSLLSTITFDFDASQAEAAPAPPRVPDVSGYTELKARRVLIGMGYAVDTSVEVVRELIDVDRVVTQHPVEGEELDLGATVMIFIGKQADG